MIVPKKDRKIIYSYLFQEGVICAKKDHMGNNKLKSEGSDEPNVVKNLFVIKLMTSLKSRGYVRETFSWQHYYWYLTDEGIEYLREYLHLPPEIVPDTLRKPAAAKPARPDARAGGDRRGGFGRDRFGDRGDSKWGNRGGFGGDKPGFGRGGRMRDDGYRRAP